MFIYVNILCIYSLPVDSVYQGNAYGLLVHVDRVKRVSF